MTIIKLLNHLAQLIEHGADPKAHVIIYDPDAELTQRVTGSLYDPNKLTLELCADK